MIIPKRLSRLIQAREKSRVLPDCGDDRHIQVHHAVHALNGGPAIDENLVALRWLHHHLIQEGGWPITVTASFGIEIKSPFGHSNVTSPLVIDLVRAG